MVELLIAVGVIVALVAVVGLAAVEFAAMSEAEVFDAYIEQRVTAWEKRMERRSK